MMACEVLLMTIAFADWGSATQSPSVDHDSSKDSWVDAANTLPVPHQRTSREPRKVALSFTNPFVVVNTEHNPRVTSIGDFRDDDPEHSSIVDAYLSKAKDAAQIHCEPMSRSAFANRHIRLAVDTNGAPLRVLGFVSDEMRSRERDALCLERVMLRVGSGDQAGTGLLYILVPAEAVIPLV
jgi:hypothetical protein